MEKTVAINSSKDTFTLRIPTSINIRIKELANEIGISQNDLILLFINLGMSGYKEFTLHQKEQLAHVLIQNLK